MCVVLTLVAVAPLAQSEPGTIHDIIKDENGPPSTCAETWGVTPSKDWTWHGHIVNYGLRWLVIDVIDIETGDVLIDREMYRFALYPEGWVDTEKISLVAGHTYMVTATPNGPIGSSCTVEDVLEGPPVAAFTASVEGTTVSVDASASYDPDGTIVSYDWDWGDGTTGTGETASHTYVLPETVTVASSQDLGGPPVRPPLPYIILGYTTDVYGSPLPNCTVTVTNVDKSTSRIVESDSAGLYICDLLWLGDPIYSDGDEILVEAVKGSLAGCAIGYVDLDVPYIRLDVMLVEGVFEMTITLSVTDNEGMVSTISQTVTLYY